MRGGDRIASDQNQEHKHVRDEKQRNDESWNEVRGLQHGVIPGPCHTKARGISSPGIDEGPPHGALQSWRAAMEHYVGLDVSLKLTAICIVDQTGRIEREGVVASNPEAIAAFIKSHAPHVTRIGLETGATSTWLW